MTRRFIIALLCCTALSGMPTPAKAEPISAAIGLTALLGGGAVASAIGGAIVTGVIGIGASLLQRVLMPKPQSATSNTSASGTQINVQFGATVPRSRIFGYQATAGQFLYWNLSGADNKYLEQVFAVGDGPHHSLAGAIVNGKEATFGTPDGIGTPIVEFNAEDGTPRLWLQFHQGFEDQAADARLVETANPAGRWTAADRLAGIAYVRVTALYDEKVFSGGMPSLLFIIKGALLYDCRKDSTNGGSGAHRWADQHTWEWSDNPPIGLYNYQRGLYLNGELVLGEGLAPFDLITGMYVTAANACDEDVTLKDASTEKRYRIAMNVGADQQHATVIQKFLDAMAGQLLEQVGSFGPVAGVAQIVTLPTITDADLIVGKQVKVSRKRSRADLINAVFGSYTEPTQQYGLIPYPPRTSAADETADKERLARQIDRPQIVSQTQAQRVVEIERRLSRAQGTATITVRARWAVAEPGDWVPWNSAKHGNIVWRIDRYTINDDETVTLSLREISAAVYEFDPEVDQLDPTQPGDLPGFGDLATTVAGFTLAPTQIYGANNLVIPALRCLWSPVTDRSIVQVIVQYRVKTVDDSGVIKQAAPFVRPDAGEDLITEGIQAGTIYEARATIVTIPARVTVYTNWVEQLAPPLHVVPVSNETLLAKFEALSAEVRYNVTTLQDQTEDTINTVEQLIASVTANLGARNANAFDEVRFQIGATYGTASATIEQVRTVAASATAALASDVETLTASVGDNTAQITSTKEVVADINTGLAATVTVTTTINGWISGTALFNGGPGLSAFIIQADKFAWALPGYNGDAPKYPLVAGTLGGVTSFGFSGDMYLDNTFHARAVIAGTITGVMMVAQTVATAQLAIGGVDFNVLLDGAASNSGGYAISYSGSGSIVSGSLNIQGGRAIILCNFTIGGSAFAAFTSGFSLLIDGVVKASWSINSAATTVSTGSTTYSIPMPVSVSWLETGLSAGSHTFSLRNDAQIASAAGTMIVLNPRR